MSTTFRLTKRGKRIQEAINFVAGVSLTWGIIFGAAVLEKIAS